MGPEASVHHGWQDTTEQNISYNERQKAEKERKPIFTPPSPPPPLLCIQSHHYGLLLSWVRRVDGFFPSLLLLSRRVLISTPRICFPDIQGASWSNQIDTQSWPPQFLCAMDPSFPTQTYSRTLTWPPPRFAKSWHVFLNPGTTLLLTPQKSFPQSSTEYNHFPVFEFFILPFQ